jgi:sterol desaturase/sphingolipid hydroxylase (fatty acid hydroxylase superfamily)
MPELLKPLVGFAVLALLLLWETAAPYLRLFGNGRARAVHAVRNLALALINAAAGALILALLWTQVAHWATSKQFGILNALPLSGVPRAIAAVVLFDAWMYAWHRLNHRLPLLWRFHRVHHADPCMDVTTAHRFHVGEIVLSGLVRAPVLALLGMTLVELALYELLMFAIVQLHHANVALPGPLERACRLFVVTPHMHKVHHSRLRHETDSNYGSLFSWWDRVCRSFALRDDPRQIQFGLEQFDGPEQQRLTGMLGMPACSVEPPLKPPALRQ